MLMTDETAAGVMLTTHCMAQEKAFGLTITFPPEVEDIANIPFQELTEEQGKKLIEAGMRARHEALYGKDNRPEMGTELRSNS